ncbi:MAG TPA: BREX system ATP-binding domain-containing protein [Dehalococcoidia bacterium]|nr:BREX system ATP-binding domain-containing protein [Dehalococcoidia bacterium]
MDTVTGKRVEHRRFGQGTVQEMRHRGLELFVLFEDGIKRWVRLEDVRFLSSSPVLNVAPPPIPTMTPEALRSRHMIEAFRSGIVPYRHVEHFTFGRDEEIEFIKGWLNDGDTGTLAVEGQYGSGKTHLLDYLYALALTEGYAVARAEFDPNEAPPFRPKAVYRKLIEGFRYQDGGKVGNFQDFLRAAASQDRSRLREHRYLSFMALSITTTGESASLWDWIQGKETSRQPGVLYDHGTAANIYCHILAGLGCAAVRILRLRGLVLIFDEAESILHPWNYWYQNEKGFNFIHGLSLLASSDPRLLDEAIDWEYRPGVGSCFGRETGLVYHGRASDVRYCCHLPSFVKMVLAVTPGAYGFDVVDRLQQFGAPVTRLHLRPLSDGALKQLFHEICLLYQSAYGPVELRDDAQRCFGLVKARSGTGTRSFIKGSVEILDLRRFHPDLPLEAIE